MCHSVYVNVALGLCMCIKLYMCAYASVHVCIQVTMSLVRFKRDHEGKTSEKLKSTPFEGSPYWRGR